MEKSMMKACAPERAAVRVNFLTFAFDESFSDEFIAALKPWLPLEPSFVFVASDFGRREKSEKHFRVFLEYFQEKGITFSETHIVDFSISREIARELIDAADVVWLSGGDTLLQISQIREYGLVEPLRERSGVTIGMSAGSINMARRVVLAKDESDNIPELSVYDGIGLVDFNIEPHVNTAGPEHIEEIREASEIAPIIGLYDGSFILETEGRVQIFGKYDVYCGGEHHAGPWHPKTGINL